jgi:hypothetical protein
MDKFQSAVSYKDSILQCVIFVLDSELKSNLPNRQPGKIYALTIYALASLF